MRLLIFLLILQINSALDIQRHWLPESAVSKMRNHRLVQEGFLKQFENSPGNKGLKAAPFQLQIHLQSILKDGLQASVKFKRLQKNGVLPVVPHDWILLGFPDGLRFGVLKDSPYFGFVEGVDQGELKVLIPFSRAFSTGLARNIEISWESFPESDLVMVFGSSRSRYRLDEASSIRLMKSESLRFHHEVKSQPVAQPQEEKKELAKDIKSFELLAPVSFQKSVAQVKIERKQAEILSHFELNVLHQGIQKLALKLGKDQVLQKMNFEPKIPFNWDGKVIHFTRPVLGRVKLVLQLRTSVENDGKFKLELPTLQGPTDLGHILYFLALGNVQIKSVDAKGLEPINLLPIKPLEQLDLPILKKFRGLQTAPEIQIEKKTLPEVKTRRYEILQADSISVVTGGMKMAHALKLTMLNQGLYNLPIPLPEDVQLLGAYVNSKPVKTFRNEAGVLNLHLPQSKSNRGGLTPILVEVKYLQKQAVDQEASLKFPDELKAFKTNWDVYYPSHWDLTKVDSNLQHGFRPEKVSSPLHHLQHLLGTFFSPVAVLPFLLILGVFLFGVKSLFSLLFSLKSGTWTLRSILLPVIALCMLLVFILAFLVPNFRQARMQSTVMWSEGNRMEKKDREMHKLRRSTLNIEKRVDRADLNQAWIDVGGSASGRQAIELDGQFNLKSEDDLFESAMAPPPPPPSRKVSSFYSKSSPGMARKQLVRRKKSQYKKVQKSGIKPVEIQFPRLARKLSFRASYPTAKSPELSMKWKSTPDYNMVLMNSLPLVLLWAGLCLSCLIYSKYVLFGAFASAGLLALHTTLPATFSRESLFIVFFLICFGACFKFLENLRFKPGRIFAFFFLLSLVSENYAAGSYLQELLKNARSKMSQEVNSPAQSTVSARAQRVQAPSVKQFQNSMQNNMRFQNYARNEQYGFSQTRGNREKRRSILNPKIRVYEIVDLQKGKRLYDKEVLLSESDYKKILRMREKPVKKSGQVLSEKITLEPDYQNHSLIVQYEFQLDASSDLLLLEANENLQILEVSDPDGKELALKMKRSSGIINYILPGPVPQRVTVKASVPLEPIGLTGEFKTYLPISFAAAHEISFSGGSRLVPQVVGGVHHEGKLLFANLQNPLPIEFRKDSPREDLLPRITNKRRRQGTTRRATSFQRKQSQVFAREKLSWEQPLFMRKLNFVIHQAESFRLPKSTGDQLLSYTVRTGSKALKEGIDFGLTRNPEELKFEFDDLKSKIIINVEFARVFEGKNKLEQSLVVPFLKSEFQRNEYQLETIRKEGQEIKAEPSVDLAGFLNRRRSSGKSRLVFENLTGGQISLRLEQRELVSYSSARCHEYFVESFYAGGQELLMKVYLVLSNEGNQFLKMKVPAAYQLSEAQIGSENITPARDEDSNLLLPLKMYRDKGKFLITLSFRIALDEGEEFTLDLPKPILDVDQVSWNFYTGNTQVEFFKEGSFAFIKNARQSMINKSFRKRRNSPGSTPALNWALPKTSHFFGAHRNGFPENVQIQFKRVKPPKKDHSHFNPLPLLPLFFLLITGFLMKISLKKPKIAPVVHIAFLALSYIALEFSFRGIFFHTLFEVLLRPEHFLLFYFFFLIQYLAWFSQDSPARHQEEIFSL